MTVSRVCVNCGIGLAYKAPNNLCSNCTTVLGHSNSPAIKMNPPLKLFRMTILDPMKIGLMSSPNGTMELIILGVDENNIAQWVVNTFKRDKGFSKDTKIKSIEEITGPFVHGTIIHQESK